MELLYGEAARDAGVYMASACAYDSVPCDMGTLFVQRKFQQPSVPASVECFLTIKVQCRPT